MPIIDKQYNKSQFTIQSLSLALKAGRGTVRKYIMTPEFNCFIKIVEKRSNKVSIELLVPLEEFKSFYYKKRDTERKNAIMFAMAKNPRNMVKVAV
jgi:hypothetical protein